MPSFHEPQKPRDGLSHPLYCFLTERSNWKVQELHIKGALGTSVQVCTDSVSIVSEDLDNRLNKLQLGIHQFQFESQGEGVVNIFNSV